MLRSTHQRLGAPLVVACGPSRVEEGLHVGLLFVADRVTRETITLTDGQERITVSIPNEYLNLPAPKWAANILLEVT